MKKKYFILLSIFIFFSLNPAQAKVFKNSYIQFTLPHQWDCELKNTAWVCRHQIPLSCQKNKSTKVCQKAINASKEAIIILAAKEASNIDSFDNYISNLKEPRKISSRKGTSSQSQVINAKLVKVDKEQWVDGMHLSSELPHYYTRYLATIKGKIAVLVTFSAHKIHYTKYSSIFFKTIKTLKVTSSNIDKVNKKELGEKVLSYPIDLPDELFEGMQEGSGTEGDSSSTVLFTLALLLAAFGLYIWFKRRK